MVCGVELVEERVVNHADDGLFIDEEANGDLFFLGGNMYSFN